MRSTTSQARHDTLAASRVGTSHVVLSGGLQAQTRRLSTVVEDVLCAHTRRPFCFCASGLLVGATQGQVSALYTADSGRRTRERGGWPRRRTARSLSILRMDATFGYVLFVLSPGCDQVPRSSRTNWALVHTRPSTRVTIQATGSRLRGIPCL